MNLVRDLLTYAILAGLSILLAHWPSYWLAFSDYADCTELGCGILAFILWPILSLVFFVDPVSQLFARFEVRHKLALEADRLAGLRVTAHARGAIMQREAAKTADLDAIASGEAL